MRRWHWVGVLALLAGLLGGARPAEAQTIDTGPWGGGMIGSFGEPDTATYGQTFTATSTEAILDRFRFSLASAAGPDAVEFKGYVMEWTGTRATGPILYQSALQSLSPGSSMTPFQFETGGIGLVPGKQYVAFLSASTLFDGQQGLANMASVPSHTYTGGNFVFSNNGSNFAALTTSTWSETGAGNWGDALFRAEFRGEGDASAVPEPSSALLFLPALAIVGVIRRRRGQ